MSTIDPLYPGNTYIRQYTFTDESGVAYDPTAIAISIVDPSGTVVATKSISDLTSSETGVYIFKYNLPSDADPGTWYAIVTSTYAAVSPQLVKTKVFPFIVDDAP